MPKQTKRPKAKPDLQAMSRIGPDQALRQLFGDGDGRADEPAVPKVQGPGLLTCGCGGVGFTFEMTGTGDRLARDCACRGVVRFEASLKRAGLPDRYLGASFESYQPTHPSQEFARVKARRSVEMWPADSRGLLLVGSVGTGKTHLGVSMLRALSKKGAACRFVNLRVLLKEVQATFSGGPGSEAELTGPVKSADVVLIDDLGAEMYTDWRGDMVSDILNTRYDDNRTTHITTNHAVQAPGWRPGEERGGMYAVAQRAVAEPTLGDRIGARMLSRLREMCDVVDVLGEDYRARSR